MFCCRCSFARCSSINQPHPILFPTPPVACWHDDTPRQASFHASFLVTAPRSLSFCFKTLVSPLALSKAVNRAWRGCFQARVTALWFHVRFVSIACSWDLPKQVLLIALPLGLSIIPPWSPPESLHGRNMRRYAAPACHGLLPSSVDIAS